MNKPRYPLLYQVNTRLWLRQLSQSIGRPATLDDIPDRGLEQIARLGFDWIYLLGVWQTGDAGRRIAMTTPGLRAEYERLLPDLEDDDICGSPFAISGYTVHARLGGEAAMQRLRQRLRRHGLLLMLDFVPNHTALDHPWVEAHPDYYTSGAQADLLSQPHNYVNLQTGSGKRVLAHGRDPYFPGWTDTLQLNYGNPALQEAMQQVLLSIAAQCDGARCDMAMLLLPEIFKRTWGVSCQPFWPDAICRVKAEHPQFTFMAEVYWDLEWQLQQQGFDYTYDKRLYDRLRQGQARPVRDHLRAGLDYQEKSARFLENHDEPRAASILPPEGHQAAAVITFLSPCLRFFHQGQLEGYTRKIPVQLCRAPAEIPDPRLQDFYRRLLACLRLPPLRDGDWQMLEPLPAAAGNPTWDGIIAYAWSDQEGESLLAVVNYSPVQAQCNLKLPFLELDRAEALLSSPNYPDRQDLRIDAGNPMFLADLPPWGYRLYALSQAP